MVHHIIWDYNGTLLDDVELAIRTDNSVFRRLGLPLIDADTYRRYITMPICNFYVALGVDLEKHPYEQINRIWLEEFNRQAVDTGLVPGILDLLREIQETGVTQSILSACYEPELRRQCSCLGVTPFMQAIDGRSQDDGGLKTEIGHRQIETLGLHPGEIVLVGDMAADAELAKELGVRCILVTWGHSDRVRLDAQKVPVADGLPELKQLLKTI